MAKKKNQDNDAKESEALNHTKGTIELLKNVRESFNRYAANVVLEESEGRTQGTTRLKSITECFEILNLIDKSIFNSITHNVKYNNIYNSIKYLRKNIPVINEDNNEEQLKYSIRDIVVLMTLADNPIKSYELFNENMNAAADDYTLESDVRNVESFYADESLIVPDDRDYLEENNVFKENERS